MVLKRFSVSSVLYPDTRDHYTFGGVSIAFFLPFFYQFQLFPQRYEDFKHMLFHDPYVTPYFSESLLGGDPFVGDGPAVRFALNVHGQCDELVVIFQPG